MRTRLLIRSAGAGFLMILLLCSLLALAVPGRTQEEGEQRFNPTMIQIKSVKLDSLGDAAVTFTIQYKKESLFKKVSKLAKKYKNFISRHYDRDDTLKVVKNFKQKIDDANMRIVLTYDSPGYAYNWEDYWSIGGMQKTELTKKTKKTMEFKYDYRGRGDLTYYTNQPVRSVYKYTAPSGATDLRYDSRDGRVKYDLEPPPAGFFDQNKVWLSAMFGALALLFLGLLVLVAVMTRRRPEMAGAPAPVEPAAARMPSAVQPEGEDRICPNCGKKDTTGAKFCTGCGQPL